jgi:4-carboxymuconolactone decarboxylase
MVDPAERRQRGEAKWRDVMVSEPPPPITPYKEQGILDFVFSEMWTRPGLTRKERRWITLACVGAVGQPHPVRSHMRAAFESGDCTFDEMKEFVFHYAVYMGWPSASFLESTMLELADELGLSASTEAGPSTDGE